MKFFEVKIKLFVLVVFVLMGNVFIGTLSLRFIEGVHQQNTILTEHLVPFGSRMERMNRAFSNYWATEMQYSVLEDRETLDALTQKIHSLESMISNSIEEYKVFVSSTEEIKLVGTVEEAWQSWRMVHEEMLSLKKSGKTEEAIRCLTEKAVPLFYQISETISKGLSLNEDCTTEIKVREGDQYESIMLVLLVGIAVFSILFVVISVLIGKSIITQMKALEDTANDKKTAEL